MKHTHNPDNRTENLEILKTKINNTRHNYEVADEIIDSTNNDRLKNTLKEKNAKRDKALNSFELEKKSKY
jgi:small acid-soluble spore protein (thioredoxin-like protein)